VRRSTVSIGLVSSGVRWQYHCLPTEPAILGE
jgi:hypothetical protein